MTVTLPGASIAASPQITVTLFFFIRKPTPSLSRFDTARERFTTAPASNADLLGREPVVLGVLHVVVDLGRAQQRLGRDAAPVQADAAEIGALDDRGLESELRRADRRDIAARAGADDDHVERGVGHRAPQMFPATVCTNRPISWVLVAALLSNRSGADDRAFAGSRRLPHVLPIHASCPSARRWRLVNGEW